MHCIKKIKDDLIWVGANDRRLAMFEGVYSVPRGVSYNAYLILDEKTVLVDCVDKAVRQRMVENLKYGLDGRNLDYLIIQHMEPDHSAALMDVLALYPDVKVVCNEMTCEMINNFYSYDLTPTAIIVNEGDTLDIGRRKLTFLFAPMVHWPEVMVTYDTTDKVLFSADAFGCFGALNGALFADEVDFERDYLDEARRYYTNIVGKYGTQVMSLLNKASTVEIDMVCPLHGFVWRRNINSFVSKYMHWGLYEPEEKGVMIAYASVYGNTENAAEILATKLRNKGIKTEMFDVSVTHISEIVSASFKWSHLVFASTTYNAGIFVTMEALIADLVAHNIQNRTVAIIENGSWAPTSGGLIAEKLEECERMTILNKTITIISGLKSEQLVELDAMADALAETLPTPVVNVFDEKSGDIDPATISKLSYGLFVLTALCDGKDNGCIVNTVMQITDSPLMIAVAVNKANQSCDMIVKTGKLNISVLDESTPFDIIKQFGFSSGKDVDKFAGVSYDNRTANGIRYIPVYTNGVISADVCSVQDHGAHMLFIADVTQAFVLSNEHSVTYQYYFDHIKPKPQLSAEKKHGFICKVCGYVYEDDVLPDDYICPLCKHPASDFEPL